MCVKLNLQNVTTSWFPKLRHLYLHCGLRKKLAAGLRYLSTGEKCDAAVLLCGKNTFFFFYIIVKWLVVFCVL